MTIEPVELANSISNKFYGKDSQSARIAKQWLEDRDTGDEQPEPEEDEDA